ncbi:RNA polymerase sigma factor [soil metagenome]
MCPLGAATTAQPGNVLLRPSVAESMGNHDVAVRRNQAFRDHVVAELDVLLRVALRLTRDRHDAEDLVQETLLRAYRALDRFDGAYPRAWLLTIMRNANHNRARKRVPALLADDDRTFAVLPARGADGREGPAESVTETMPDAALIEALTQLSPAHQAVVAMVDVYGLSYHEAAKVLGVPMGTVTSRLHRARRRLRADLQRLEET